MANYRRIYEKHYGVKIPKDYDIHHIDEDRENNDPSNLLALPRQLHRKWHFAKSGMRGLDIEMLSDFTLSDSRYCVMMARHVLDAREEIDYYINQKLLLDYTLQFKRAGGD